MAPEWAPRWFDDSEGTEGLENQVDLLSSWGYDRGMWEAERVQLLLESEVVFPSHNTPVAIFRNEGWVHGRSLVDRLIQEARTSAHRCGTPAP